MSDYFSGYGWADLDNANKADGHYDKHPKHPDYYKICQEVERSKTKYFNIVEAYENDNSGIIAFQEVLDAQEYYELCLDAERYMWALYYREDCICLPDHDMCRFCSLENRYKKWKQIKNNERE